MLRTLLLFSLVVILFTGQAFKSPGNGPVAEKIKWLSFKEAYALNKKNPKKIFIDVYTDWCGWCKRMDATTFSDPVIAKNMNKYYYAVKLDAEMSDTVVFNNTTFVNPNPGMQRSTHQLAYALLNGKLGYPTCVFLDEKFGMIQPISSYLSPDALEPILAYIGGNHMEKKVTWEAFQKTFKSELKAAK